MSTLDRHSFQVLCYVRLSSFQLFDVWNHAVADNDIQTEADELSDY